MADEWSVALTWVRYKAFPISSNKRTRFTQVDVLTNRLWREGRRWASTQSVTHSLTHDAPLPVPPVATLREGALLLSLPVLFLASHPSIIGSTTAHPLLSDWPLLQNTGAPEGRAGHLKVAAVLGRIPVHWGNTTLLVGQSDDEM